MIKVSKAWLLKERRKAFKAWEDATGTQDGCCLANHEEGMIDMIDKILRLKST